MRKTEEWRQGRKAEAVNCTQMQIQGSDDSLNPLGIFCQIILEFFSYLAVSSREL